LFEEQNDLTISEVTEFTGLPRKAVEGYIRRGKWASYLDAHGHRRIPQSELDNFGMESFDDQAYDIYSYDPKFDIPKAEIWGTGKAPVVQPSTNEQWETVIFVSDIHVPYHDPVLIDSAVELIEDVQPHRVVINGDTNDFFSLSRFNRAMERLDLLQMEIDMGRQLRQAFRNAAPNAIMDETIGNHEERLLTYPGFNAPALKSLSALKPVNLLGLEDLEITHWPMNGFRLREDFLVEHGAVVRKHSGATAKARLDDTLISGIMGHTHRMDSHRRSGYRDLAWFEQGCLCLLNPDYVKSEANWKQGIALGLFSTKTNNFDVQLIPATGRGFIFNGKHYGQTNVEADIWSGPVPVKQLTYA
jgi:predicted phosphodiesterase